MSGRRVAPLIALSILAALVVVLRLAVVQLGQHELWAGEAANLVSTSRVLPYTRGRILDSSRAVRRSNARLTCIFTAASEVSIMSAISLYRYPYSLSSRI